MERKIHIRDLRLRNNAGMDFPECQGQAKLLDCDKSRWRTTGSLGEVTCKNCLRLRSIKNWD